MNACTARKESPVKFTPFAIVLLAATLTACTSTPLNTPDVTDRTATPVNSGGAGSGSAGTGQGTGASTIAKVEIDPLNDPKGVLAKRSIFFEYDSYEIQPAGRAVVEEHSKYLRGKPNAQIRIEGHADERGGREYNLALGQKRADAVRRAMALLGVTDKQMEAVSFGKEKPMDPGHDEAAWAKNRRVDIAYPGK